MTPCDPCQRAAAGNPRVDEWTGACVSCAARALVAMGFHGREHRSTRIFGDDIEQGRAEIQRWAGIFRQWEAQQKGRLP